MDYLYVVNANKVFRKARTVELSELLDGPIEIDKARQKKKMLRKKTSVYVKKVPKESTATLNPCRGQMRTLGLFQNYYLRYREQNPDYVKYKTYFIKKKSRGLRKIEEPHYHLKDLQRRVIDTFKNVLPALRSSQAFAYAKGRRTKDALLRHTYNKSRWYLKLDIHNFFGTTTIDTIMSQLKKIHPFNVWIEEQPVLVKETLEKIFLNSDGVLPQGAPSSPDISNLIMIPFDYEMNKWCRENHLIYTRYADDMLISGRNGFKTRDVISKVTEIMRELGLRYELNLDKTRYGSYKGKNFNLGLMCNGNFDITIGHKRKKYFKAMLTRMIMAGNGYPSKQKRKLKGIYEYYKSIEPEYMAYLTGKYNQKFNVNLEELMKKNLYLAY